MPGTDHKQCTDECAQLAVRSPWNRPKLPGITCPHCSAPAGAPCVIRRPMRRTQELCVESTHVARIEAARTVGEVA